MFFSRVFGPALFWVALLAMTGMVIAWHVASGIPRGSMLPAGLAMVVGLGALESFALLWWVLERASERTCRMISSVVVLGGTFLLIQYLVPK